MGFGKQRNPLGEKPRRPRSTTKSLSRTVFGAGVVTPSKLEPHLPFTLLDSCHSNPTHTLDLLPFSYAGEITLWSGPSLLALPAVLANTSTSIPLSSRLPSYLAYLTFIPPIFEYLLLSRVSGVPLLEEKGDKKWGDDKGPGSWNEYKEKVPVLFGWPGSKI